MPPVAKLQLFPGKNELKKYVNYVLKVISKSKLCQLMDETQTYPLSKWRLPIIIIKGHWKEPRHQQEKNASWYKKLICFRGKGQHGIKSC